MGIHVLKDKSYMEENVTFTDPYIKRKISDKYRYFSLLQFQATPQKKLRLVEVGVSETEILQQQHLALVSGMQNLVLTETKE